MINSTGSAVQIIGKEITGVRTHDGTIYVPLKALCAFLGINYDRQRSKISNGSAFFSELVPIQGKGGRKRKMLCLRLEQIGDWAATISTLIPRDLGLWKLSETYRNSLKKLWRIASFIIENLLRSARPSQSTEMAEVNLTNVINDVLQLVSNQAKIGKISISVNCPNKEMSVHGNANLLQQMFLNLFLNAFNSMPEGGQLTVYADRSENAALVRIEDTGSGISPQHLELIFDPFFTQSPPGKGTGLGLSICYSIVRQHIGNIEVESVEGEGTKFTVQLPLL